MSHSNINEFKPFYKPIKHQRLLASPEAIKIGLHLKLNRFQGKLNQRLIEDKDLKAKQSSIKHQDLII